MKAFIIPIFIPNLGCPFRCVFCDQSKNTGKTETFLSSEEISKEISRWLDYPNEKGRLAEVAFYGGTFTSLPIEEQERMLKAAAPFLEAGSVSSIRLSTRPDSISEENLLLLKENGVKTIELGVQSMDDNVLLKSGRGYSKEVVIEAVTSLKKYKFNIGIQLMPGLPGDTFEKNIATAEEVVKLVPNFVRIYPTIVIKGTKLEQLYKAGNYFPLTLKEGVSRSADMVKLFRKNNIKVIRVGLQSAPTLEEVENIVAGPYHPSFGEMVESHLNYMEIEAIFAERSNIVGEVRIRVPQRELSSYIGNRGENRQRLIERFNLDFVISGDENIEAGSIVYESGEGGEEIIRKREYV